MRFAAAICVTRPPGASLTDSVVALREHAPGLRVIVVAAGAAGVDLERVHALATGAETFSEPLLNRAAARNRALRVCEEEVVAFVDDDVVVDHGWAEALAEAWAAAPPATACIGGAVALRFPGTRPRWVSPEVERPLGQVALGPARTLDRPLDVVPGGNLSFRRSTLLGIGGFEERFGQPGHRDWFSEESAAQRGLRHAGFTIAWDPAITATRMIVHPRPAALLREGYRAGARLAGHDALDRAAAGRQAARSAGGTLLAIARRDPAAAMKSARRTAEAIGALPRRTGPQAPRAVTSRSAMHPGTAPRILTYHRIADVRDDPLGLAVSPRHFAEHLDVLTCDWKPLALEELAACVRRGRVPDRAVAITLDDGYADNLTAAAPALVQRSVPATFFPVAGQLGAEGFWWDELASLISVAPGPELSLCCASERVTHPFATDREREVARREVHAWVQPRTPGAIRQVLDQLRELVGGPPALCPPLAEDALRKLAALPGVTIGSHTLTHPNLAYRSLDDQRHELGHSRAMLRDVTGQNVAVLSYPFGLPGSDFTAATAALADAAGYSAAVMNWPGAVATGDPFALPRDAVPDVDGAAFERWLVSGVTPFPPARAAYPAAYRAP